MIWSKIGMAGGWSPCVSGFTPPGCFELQVEKLYKEREKVLRELEHAEAVFERSKRKAGDDGVRPMHKTGFLGYMGPKVDTIDYLANRSADLTTQFEEEKKHVLQTEKSHTAFVIFNSRRSAAQAGQVN